MGYPVARESALPAKPRHRRRRRVRTWDGENRLTAVTTDASTGSGQVQTEHHQYAATGLRRRKGDTSYLWDGQNLLAEMDAALSTLAQYTDFPGRWGGLSAMRRGGASRFYGYDMSANTRDLLDAAGAAEAYLYSAFGPELVGGPGANPYRFGGQVGYYRDTAERLYVRAREYAPGMGRWLSRDPLGSAAPAMSGWLTAYSYASNDPVMGLDPSGLVGLGVWRVIDTVMTIVAGVAAVAGLFITADIWAVVAAALLAASVVASFVHFLSALRAFSRCKAKRRELCAAGRAQCCQPGLCNHYRDEAAVAGGIALLGAFGVAVEALRGAFAVRGAGKEAAQLVGEATRKRQELAVTGIVFGGMRLVPNLGAGAGSTPPCACTELMEYMGAW